jgi:hypothetical protein
MAGNISECGPVRKSCARLIVALREEIAFTVAPPLRAAHAGFTLSGVHRERAKAPTL